MNFLKPFIGVCIIALLLISALGALGDNPLISLILLGLTYITYKFFLKSKKSEIKNYNNNSKTSFSKPNKNYKHSTGTNGVFEVPFTLPSSQNLTGLLLKNKYKLCCFLRINDYGYRDGEPAYICYCYDAKVKINGSFASINELNGMNNANNFAQKHINNAIGNTITVKVKDFKTQ